MPRFPVAAIVVLALVAMPVLALGCAKRLATPVLPGPTAGTAPTPSPGSSPAGDGSSSATASSTPGAAGTPAAPSSAGSGARPGGQAGASGTRPNPQDFGAVRDVQDIFFDFDSYDIRTDAAKILDANARWMKANPTALILIEGHSDERGTNDYNLALGERRAKAAMNYLIGQGLPADRFTIISYGEEWPACQEKTEACWARNRRAHFLAKRR